MALVTPVQVCAVDPLPRVKRDRLAAEPAIAVVGGQDARDGQGLPVLRMVPPV